MNKKMVIVLLLLGIFLMGGLIIIAWRQDITGQELLSSLIDVKNPFVYNQLDYVYGDNEGDLGGSGSIDLGGSTGTIEDKGIVTQGVTTYTETYKKVCNNGRCTLEEGTYVKEGDKFVDWKDAKSLKADGRWSCNIKKNISSDPNVICIDFNYTSKTFSVQDTTATKQVIIPIKRETYIDDVLLGKTKGTENITTITLKDGIETKTITISSPIGEKIHIGESSTIITINGSTISNQFANIILNPEVGGDAYIKGNTPGIIKNNILYPDGFTQADWHTSINNVAQTLQPPWNSTNVFHVGAMGNGGVTDIWTMTSLNASSTTAIKVWIYGNPCSVDAGDAGLGVAISNDSGSTWSAEQQMLNLGTQISGGQWYSFTFPQSLSQAQIDNLQVKSIAYGTTDNMCVPIVVAEVVGTIVDASEVRMAMNFGADTIPSGAIIEKIEVQQMFGFNNPDTPTCDMNAYGIPWSNMASTAGSTITFYNASGYWDESLTSAQKYDLSTSRSYGTETANNYRYCSCPGSSEWGAINVCGIGHNQTYWTTLNSNANADLQAIAGTATPFLIGEKIDTGYFKAYGDGDWATYNQQDQRIRVTYSEGLGTSVTTCGTISTPGNYQLNNSISSTNTCIFISSSNVLFDLNGFNITHLDAGTADMGIEHNSGLTNVTIQNGLLDRWGSYAIYGGTLLRNLKITRQIAGTYGVRDRGADSVWDNITIEYPQGASGRAFYLSGSRNNVLNNVNVTCLGTGSITLFGIYMGSDPLSWTLTNSTFDRCGYAIRSTGNIGRIYNNYFNCRYYPQEYSSANIQLWNTTLTTKTNIVGGGYIGGNYWGLSTLVGYSESCVDVVAPIGICDNIFTIIVSNDKDYLPLSSNNQDTASPTISWITPQNNTYTNGNILLYVSATDNFGIQNVNFSYYNSSLGWVQLAIDTNSPYQTLWGTSSLGSGQYQIKANATDVNGNSNSTYLTINIDKSIPIVTATTTYPNSQTEIRNGQVIQLDLTATDGSGAGIKNVSLNPNNINQTNVNTSMEFVGGSLSTGLDSYFQDNITINIADSGTKQVPYYVYDNATPSNINRGSSFSVDVDNAIPYWTDFNNTQGVQQGQTITFYINSIDNYRINVTFSSNITGTWVNETIGTAISPYYAEKQKTLNKGNYTYRFILYDGAGNYNITPIAYAEVLGQETGATEVVVFNPYPDNNYQSTGINQNFSYYYTSGNATNCSFVFNGGINQTNFNAVNNTNYNFTIPLISSGTYNWNVLCVDNNTLAQIFGEDKSIIIPDLIYPSFSNFQDNNGSFTPVLGVFNVSILNSNGNAGIELNGVNYSANLVGNIYNFSKILTTGTYPYYWWAYGNGTSTNYNSSSIRYFSVNALIVDNERPKFSNFLLSKANNSEYNYADNLEFNSTIISTNGTAGIQFNNVNYSLSNISTSFYKIMEKLQVGSYPYYFWAYGNGSSHLYNSSLMSSYTIRQTGSRVDLYLDNAEANKQVDFHDILNITGKLYLGQFGSLNLSLDGTLVNSSTSGNITYSWLAEGFTAHPIISCYSGNANYTMNCTTWSVTVVHTGIPSVNIVYPASGGLYNISTLNLNYTLSEPFPDSCWYSKNGGSTNSSRVIGGTNFTGVTGVEGEQTWTVYCNDTANNLGFDSNTFDIDTIPPSVTNLQFTPSSPTEYAPNKLYQFNATITHSMLPIWAWLEFNGVNYTASNISSVYNVTFKNLGAGSYNYRWYANDSLNQLNNSESGTYIINVNSSYALSLVASPSWSETTGTETTITGGGISIGNLFRNGASVSNPDVQTLGVGLYNYTFNATNANYSYKVISNILTITEATETTPPTFTNCRNLTGYSKNSFSQSITATDASGISSYLLNDTSIFSVGLTTGLVINTTGLSVFMNNYNLSVNDTLGNMASCYFRINISLAPTTPTGTGSLCRYKSFGYWNNQLPYYKEVGCL